MSTQIERSLATRTAILKVARQSFVQEGYDKVSLDRIAVDAGVTKGALYHHYSGKEALFAALFKLVAEEIVAHVESYEVLKAQSHRDRLKALAIKWLQAVEVGDARIILLDLGPRVLGFTRARNLEDEVTFQPLLKLVEAVIETEGLKEAIEAELAARLINSALSEIALLRHASVDISPSLAAAAKAIGGVIDGVLRP